MRREERSRVFNEGMAAGKAEARAEIAVPTAWDSDDPCNLDDEEAYLALGCPNCGGEGYVYLCMDEIGCIDPESGCDLCMRRCDWCRPPKENPADPVKGQRG